MESIIAKALEYTLKYWLKSFSRDQFKLQGRTAQLYNLDINGDVLHASIGLPPALNVSTARVGKLEIMLPSVSYVQTEPIVVQIDKLDVVLEENVDSENSRSSCSAQSSTSSSKGSGYGFADKIADGMTIEVGVVNLCLIETQGGAEAPGRVITFSISYNNVNLLLYTTNENWQVSLDIAHSRLSPFNIFHTLESVNLINFGLTGLRALLRFFTGLYVCLNRGDVDPKARQRSTEAAGRSIVSIVIDHIFLCIKDADFRLELLMQSLLFFRASVSDGEDVKNLSRIMVGGLFLRDTFSHPPCTLIQPSMQAVAPESLHVPEFGENFCPSIYPLGDQLWQFNMGVPLICLHSLQIKPSPAPPSFASQTVIDCQPLMISLQEESCFRISSFLADGIVKSSMDWSAGLWQCIELQEICFEAAMVTADGGPLLNVPPEEGVVRIGVACQQFSSNASVDQLFFVLDIYAYFGRVSEKIRNVGKNKTNRHKIKEPIVSTTLHWENIHISCVDGEGLSSFVNGTDALGVQNLLAASNGHPLMRAIFWIDKERKDKPRIGKKLETGANRFLLSHDAVVYPAVKEGF
ncbi:hypothetical protein J5N97_016759 [Dioscorea zingiberensis]|uniref:Chorein N-terminal domain-containing protein n=1 Tax=Dioscorea zingiberensis TaxID=325984 RepID=A0A9D5HFP6_9LILI|nr:hypothetical protein J5N97_016759 [Dioscorea zingiberensis]